MYSSADERTFEPMLERVASAPRRSRICCIPVCGRWHFVPRALPEGLRLHRWQPERLVDPGQDRDVVGSDAAHEVDSRCPQLTNDHDKR